MTKTCPVYSQYNVYWYLYEDIGKLAPKWLPTEPNVSATPATPKTQLPWLLPKPNVSATPKTQPPVNAFVQDNGQEFDEVCLSLREHLEQAYKPIQQMQSFDWGQFEGLVWSFTDEQGKDQLMDMADMLPPADALEALLTQCDRCNALAVKLYMGNPDGQRNDHFARDAWQTQHQLETEMGEAKELASNMRLDTDMRFADVYKSLTSSSLKSNERFGWAIQTEHDNYSKLLDNTIDNLNQAEPLVIKLSHLCIDPFALNLP